MSKVFIQENFFPIHIYNEIVQQMISVEYKPPEKSKVEEHKGAYWHTHLLPNSCDVQSSIQSLIKEKFKENNINEDRRLYIESITGLKKKAEKSGMPYSILKKVYDRGMAAWKSGHRPGASQQQWAFARVNSFVTKSSGTWGGADKDLAKQVKG